MAFKLNLLFFLLFWYRFMMNLADVTTILEDTFQLPGDTKMSFIIIIVNNNCK